MSKSVIFRRVLVLLVATVLLSSLITAVMFFFVTRDIFHNSKARELKNAASNVMYYTTRYIVAKENYRAFQEDGGSFLRPFSEYDRLQEMAYYSESIQGWSDFLTCNIDIFDVEGNRMEGLKFSPARHTGNDYNLFNPQATPKPTDDREPKKSPKRVNDDVLKSHIPKITSGGGENVELVDSQSGILLVGLPIYLTTMSADGQTQTSIVGALYMSKSVVEINEVRNSLYSVLFYSMSIAALAMVCIAFFPTRRISKPLNIMRDNALVMAGGNLTVRADESQPGELGQMAGALNYLSSELGKTISELVLERNRLRRIVDGLSEGILAVDRSGSVTHWNPTLASLFDIKLDPDGHGIDQDFLSHMNIQNDFIGAMEQNCTIIRSMKIGPKILRIAISALEDEEGRMVGAVGLFRDITESERLEQTRREYVANVSHELRTPLSSLRSLAETLRDGLVKSEGDRQRYYGYMLRESMRLSRLIDDLLELSRLQSGSVAFARHKIRTQQLLEESAERYAFMCEERDISFELNSTDCPDTYGNEDRVEQVLVILLDNAVKFTPEGGKIAISSDHDDEKVYITVSDTGCGIPADELGYVFDRFYKASDKAHTGAGTGLGLSIANEILSIMGESISVKSEPGVGTTFTFTLSRRERLD